MKLKKISNGNILEPIFFKKIFDESFIIKDKTKTFFVVEHNNQDLFIHLTIDDSRYNIITGIDVRVPENEDKVLMIESEINSKIDNCYIVQFVPLVNFLGLQLDDKDLIWATIILKKLNEYNYEYTVKLFKKELL